MRYFDTPSLSTILMSCSQVRTTLKAARNKISANPPQAFCTEKFTKCPTLYLPPFYCSCQHTLRKTIPQYTEIQGIYMNICLSLRSNRQSLSRQQGIMLRKTANAVISSLIDKQLYFDRNIMDFESIWEKRKKTRMACYSIQRAVWQDGGSSPADNFVGICTLLPRRKFSGAATSPSRWGVVCKRRATCAF